MISKSLLSFCFLALTFAYSIAQTTIPPLPPCPGNGNSGFGGAIGLGVYFLDGTYNNPISWSFGLNGESDNFNDVLVIYIDTGTPGRSIIDNTIDDDTNGYTIAITNSNINNLGSTITFPNGFEATHAIAVDSESGGLWSIPNSGTIGTGDLNYITDLNATIDTSLDLYFDWEDLGLNTGDSFKYVGLYVSHLGATSDEGFGDGIIEGTSGSDDVTFTSFRHIGSCNLTLETEDKNTNRFSVHYHDRQLSLDGFYESVSIKVYDVTGRNTHASQHNIYGSETIPLKLAKNQLQFVKIEGLSISKILKVIPN